MLMNGGAGKLISDPNCSAVTVATKAESPDAKIDSLYLAFLARKPNDEERKAATEALSTGWASATWHGRWRMCASFLFIQ